MDISLRLHHHSHGHLSSFLALWQSSSKSEMDVGRVDPEVLVNTPNVKLGYVSAEIDKAMVMSANHGNEDGVLVSIWCVYLNSCPCPYTNLCMGHR